MAKKKSATVQVFKVVANLELDFRALRDPDYPSMPSKWQYGAQVVEEIPTQEYVQAHFPSLSSPWVDFGWAKWYRLKDSSGMEKYDYFPLTSRQIEEV